MRVRLQLKYSLTIAGLVIGVALIISSLLLYQFSQLAARIESASDRSLEHALNRQFINRGKALTSFLAETLINPLYNFDVTEIHRLLGIARSNEDVRFVQVFDRNGKIIHDGFEHIPSYGEHIDDPNAARVLENENLYIRFHPARIDVAMPVVFDDGKRLGGVRVGLSLDRVKKEIEASKQHLKTLSAESLKKNLYFVAIVVTTLVCLGVLAAIRIARGLSRPIGELARLSTNIGRGDFKFPIKIERNDEIGELTHSFQRMAADLTRTTVSREYLHSIIDHMGDLLVVVDSKATIKKINRKVCALLHYSETDLTGAPIDTLFPRLGGDTHSHIGSGDRIGVTETICRHRSGELIPVSLSVSRLGKEGGTEQQIFVARDIRERKAAERNIFRLAYFDTLTGLPNRVLFKDRLQQAIHVGKRERTKVAVLFLDLNRFKMINDTLGHAAGDHLLKQVSERLGHRLREEDTFSRFGGDEFAIILQNIGPCYNASVVSEKIKTALKAPFSVMSREVFTDASIGISIFPDDGDNVETLLRNADTAMYLAKRSEAEGIEFFTEDMNITPRRHLLIENGLRRAIDRNQLELYYQPQIDLKNGDCIGAEALLRWHSPELNEVSPSEFIPIAEGSGLISNLGVWVFKTAHHQQRRWEQKGISLRLSVNCSGRQLYDRKLLIDTLQALFRSTLDSAQFCLELTESFLTQDIEGGGSVLDQIHEMGIDIAIDDFGTGFSSLSRLKQFPIRYLKIDKSFIDEIAFNERDRALVDGIISLGHSLGMKLIAEGVETQQQLEFLVAHNCDIAQGYLISPPLSAAKIEQTWLKWEQHSAKDRPLWKSVFSQCTKAYNGPSANDNSNPCKMP